MELIDGKKISGQIKDEVREEIAENKLDVGLAVVIVGDDPASKVYVRNKKRACEYCGIKNFNYELPADTTEDELLDLVRKLNDDPDVNGILVQLPLPKTIDPDKVISTISPVKDVDGFHPVNVGKLSAGEDCFLPCTPAGIIELLKRSSVEMDGKHAVVIGRSNIVGKPMAMLMLRENATVTVCHSHTDDLRNFTKQADILIAAIGKRQMIDASFVKEGAVVIDVGMHRKEDGHLAGDVDFDSVSPVSSKITPVPGGVGPMTIAMLMKNCLKAYYVQNS